MDKTLVLTGVTGKSGGSLTKRLGENYPTIVQTFPGGIKAVVRNNSNTDYLKK